MKIKVAKLLAYSALGFGCAVLLIWMIFFRLPSTYSAMPISGQVVNADTGKPLEDVIVIAVWELERGFGLEGTIPSGFMNVTEVVTNKDGMYFIEGWGPLPRPGGTYLGKNAPRLTYFREGYSVVGHANYVSRYRYDNRRQSLQSSEWDGEIIRLKTFKGDLEALNNELAAVSFSLDVIFNPIFGARNCDWLKIPRMVTIFNHYDELFVENGISAVLIPDLVNLNWENQCGSEEFIQSELEKRP